MATAQGMIDLRTAAFGAVKEAQAHRHAALALGCALIALVVGSPGCIDAPSPFEPFRAGSVGTPSRGVLTGGTPLPNEGRGFVRLRKQSDRRYALPRFIASIEHAADAVAAERPGARLTIGDLSAPHGGELLPQHASHRTGRDADLLFFLTTLDGAPVESPGFLPVGPDGLAWDTEKNRYLRFDVAREWLLVRTLITDVDARVQWVFVHRNIRAMLLEWAIARGEPAFIVARAMDVMLQSGGPHDDHIHVRTACTESEVVTGCERTGPGRAWLDQDGGSTSSTKGDDLLRALRDDEAD